MSLFLPEKCLAPHDKFIREQLYRTWLTKESRKSQTPPDLVVKYQPLDIVDVVL